MVSPSAPLSIGAPGSNRSRSEEQIGESRCVVWGEPGGIPTSESGPGGRNPAWASRNTSAASNAPGMGHKSEIIPTIIAISRLRRDLCMPETIVVALFTKEKVYAASGAKTWFLETGPA